MPLGGRLTDGEDQSDGLDPETARYERQRLRRGAVEPLRIVHDPDQRPFLGHVGQKAQDGQADEEAIRGVAAAATERRAERVALRLRKMVQAIHERRAELLQPRERELHLGLDACRAGDGAPRRALYQVLEQRALTDPRLAAQHQSTARTRAHARDQLIQRRAFAAATEQLRPGSGHRHGPRLRTLTHVGNQGPQTTVFTGRDGQARRAALTAHHTNPVRFGKNTQ